MTLKVSTLENNVVSGFNLAANSGPLCNEPIAGVVFILEEFSMDSRQDEMDGTIFNI
jgi:ribosome assembly protein 1